LEDRSETIPPEKGLLDSSGAPRQFAQYEVLRTLGRGGMGIVYLARHSALDRLVAIKVLPGAMFADPDAVQRFLREARVGARLAHPNICRILDAGQEGGETYMVMEYLEGQSLREVIRRRHPLPIDLVCRLGLQLFEALKYLESENVVHRDIKPGNLMVCADDHLKLLDLGLVKDIGPRDSCQTSSGVVMGTPAYMPPEQVRGASQVTSRADLYAAGATLFEMTTGSVPYEGHFAQLLVQVLHDPVPDPRSRRPDLPEPLAGLIEALLAKEPEARPDVDWALAVLKTVLAATAPPSSTDAQPELSIAPATASPVGPARASSLVARLEEAAAQVKDPDRDDLYARLPTEDGKVRLGNYYLDNRLGPKKAISTYPARHFLTNLPAVVRVLPPAFSQLAPERLQALLAQRGRLMQVSKRCQHLTRLVDIGQAQLIAGNFKTLYYTIEDFLPGRALEDHARSGDPLQRAVARRCLAQALRGLRALHGQRILHGNLHGGKLFWDADGANMCIADLSQAYEVLDRDEDAVATLAPRSRSAVNKAGWLGTEPLRRRQYIAPEVLCEDEPPGFRTEQYALGVILVEALTGQLIRTHPNDLKLLKYVRENLEDRLEDISRASPHLGKILRRMVAMSSQSRYADVGEVLQAVTASRPDRTHRSKIVPPQQPPREDPEPAYDVFVSYRRDLGAQTARLIVQRLEQEGLRAFLDVDALTSGQFDEKLLATIAGAPHFIVVLTEKGLDRCREPGDWLRREIAHAIQTRRNIVPILAPGFQMPDPKALPAAVRPLAGYNTIKYEHEYFDAFIHKLVEFLR
jgi:serine/threonine protein kinase